MKKVLALDVATTTGWAFADVGLLPPATALEIQSQGGAVQPLSGSQHIGSSWMNDGEFYAAYEKWLDDMITVHNPDCVVYEAPYAGGHHSASKRLLAMAGCTEKVCGLKRTKVFTGNIGSVRKYFCGVGRAKRKVIKKLIQDACDLRGWTYVDDNESDALAVWEYTAACLTGRISA